MSISTLAADTATFRTWLSTTNTIIDTLNANTLVAGVAANGVFKIGSNGDLTSSLSIGGSKLNANGSNLVINVDTSLNSNVSIGTTANTFTVTTTGTTTLQSTVATIVNSASLLVRAIAEFNAATSFANTVQMTGSLVTITTATANALTVNVATIKTATIQSLTLTNSLSYSGAFTIAGIATVSNTLSVTGNTTFGANVSITGQLSTSNTLTVTGATTLNNTLTVLGATALSNTLIVTGATTLQNLSFANVTSAAFFGSSINAAALTTRSTLAVSGAATLNSTLTVFGATSIGSTLWVAGATTLNSTLNVTGATTISAGLTAASLTTGGALNVSGAAQVAGSLTVSNGFGVTSGAITLANTTAILFGNPFTTGTTGTMRLAWSGGQTYIQSGLNAAAGETSNVIFSSIGGGDEWMRIIASTKTLRVNGPIEYTQSQVMSWNTKNHNTVYQATSDGFLLATIDGTDPILGGGSGEIEILSDSSNPPATRRGITGVVNGRTTLTSPIKKGDYYTAQLSTSAGTLDTTVQWVPLGTAG